MFFYVHKILIYIVYYYTVALRLPTSCQMRLSVKTGIDYALLE